MLIGNMEANNPRRTELLTQAEAAFRNGRLSDVRRLCSSLLRANSNDADGLHLLGALQLKENLHAEAEKYVSRAIEADPSNPAFHNTLGAVRRARGDFEAAARAYRESLRLDPRLAPAQLGLGICLRALGDIDEAARQFARLARSSPKDPAVLCELGVTLRMQRRLDAAVTSFEAALKERPDHTRARRGLAETLLLGRDFDRGWPHYLRGLSSARLPDPKLKSLPFHGKRVVVYGSEGVGDQAMAVRYLDEVSAVSSGCTMYTDERLVPLFQRSFKSTTCIAMAKRQGRQVTVGATATDELSLVTSMLLPYFAGNAASKSYLIPESAALNKWHERFASLGRGLNVGISWQGGMGEARLQRSIPLALWEPLLRVPGINFVNLQYGDVAEEVELVQRTTGTIIHRWADCDPLVNLDDFAAQTQALDLVISVDNTTVHMAGALGVPVWALVPFAPNWRWMLGQESTHWYPTMRLLRQERPGDWSGLITKVQSLLGRRAAV